MVLFNICIWDIAHTLSQLEVRSKLAEKKAAGEVKPERKRRRWDQQTSEEDGPTKKKSAWDQAEVRERATAIRPMMVPLLLSMSFSDIAWSLASKVQQDSL